MANRAIDVLLPVFNGASTIVEAIESLRRQTLSDIRIIAIDDGSSDETPRILEELSRADDRIEVIRTPRGGIVDALNAGLARCQAEFVARQDADDISEPSRLALQVAHLRGEPACVAVSGAFKHMDEAGRRLEEIQAFPQPDSADPFWAPSREPYLLHPFLMARRADLLAVGGYRHVFNAEDTDLYWRLLERGTLRNLDVPLGFYRMHGQSISGASAVNGRIMAVSSQLAALSARRRRSGRPDLAFPKEAIAEYCRSPTLADIYRLAAAHLDGEERSYLRIAAAGKMLELTAYRPYELDGDDCRFIRAARFEMKTLSADNRRHLNRLYAGATARLLRKRLFAEAIALSPPRLYAPALARLVAAGVLPRGVARHIKDRRALR